MELSDKLLSFLYSFLPRLRAQFYRSLESRFA